MSITDRIRQADEALSNYDFGSEYRCVETGSWDTDDSSEFTCVVYLRAADDPQSDSFRASFHVRFDGDGNVEDIYALDMDSGGLLGQPSSGGAFYRTRFVVDVVSEDRPLDWEDLGDVHYAMDRGDCCGEVRSADAELISAKQAARLLIDLGCEPDFFRLGHIEPEEAPDDDAPSADSLREQFGGHWGGCHPAFPVEDWILEVENNDTRLGYWEWAASMLEQRGG